MNNWLLVVIPGLIWGASFLFIAEGLQAIGPNGITFIRLFIGFETLALFPASRKAVERSAWPRIALVGVLWFAFPLSMFPFAEQRVSSALTGRNPLASTDSYVPCPFSRSMVIFRPLKRQTSVTPSAA